MAVSFTDFVVGAEYTRPQLAAIWGYKSYAAISRGVVTPSGLSYILLFVTEEKQASFTQYQDMLKDGILQMEGEEGHSSDSRIVEAEKCGDEILFCCWRIIDHCL